MTGYQHYLGRTDADLARAEDLAHAKTSEYGGAKVFHIAEAFEAEDDTDHLAILKGRLFVVDEEGLASLAREFESVTTLNTFGVDFEIEPAIEVTLRFKTSDKALVKNLVASWLDTRDITIKSANREDNITLTYVKEQERS